MVKGLKAKKVFSLDDNSDYGTGLSGALEPQLKADGATVTHDGIDPTKNYTVRGHQDHWRQARTRSTTRATTASSARWPRR